MTFRKVIFWLHLIAGVVAGVVILIMCVTGAAIAFEKEAIAAAESAVRFIPSPAADAKRLSVEELLAHAKEKQPEAKPSSLVLSAEPLSAVSIGYGRTNTYYLNPYTGSISEQGALSTRKFMRLMTDWHRWLGRDGDGRNVGKAITGACNAAFLFLAVSGIVLWFPRKWSAESLKAILLFRGNLRGKARDWNWHNVIGIWTAPILVVLTVTGIVISYHWAGDLVYKLAGSAPPPAGAGPGAQAGPPVEVPKPPAGTKRMPYEALLSAVQKEAPAWEQLTLRLGGGGGGERGPQAVSITVRERGSFPAFATTQFSLDPFTGAILKKEGFADFNTGRQARMWMRFLHTGEALGLAGKTVATLACLGGAVLVWTGVALAFRRFLSRGGRSASRNLSAVSASDEVEATK